jgi:tellurite resistance protein TehA-like permease
MNIATGQTVYELIKSFNPNTKEPVVPATFINTIYTNGIINTGITINMTLSDISNGNYTASWSASTFGTHQINCENITTGVVYVSEIYLVKPDNEINPSPTIYVGL